MLDELADRRIGWPRSTDSVFMWSAPPLPASSLPLPSIRRRSGMPFDARRRRQARAPAVRYGIFLVHGKVGIVGGRGTLVVLWRGRAGCPGWAAAAAGSRRSGAGWREARACGDGEAQGRRSEERR